MEEFVIPVYSSRDMPTALIYQYPLVIQTDMIVADVGNKHDLTKIPELNMVDISKLGITDALKYRPTRNNGVVVPRLLDITLHVYDCRKKLKATRGLVFETDTEWMKWAISDRMDIQPLKVMIDEYHFINYQLFNCNVKAKSRNIDTIYYDYHPLEQETKKCNHTNLELMRSLTVVEMFHILQSAAYALKPNFTLVATAERQNVETSFNAVGSRWHTMKAGTEIKNRGDEYEKFISGLVQVEVKGRCLEAIRQEMTQLQEVQRKWDSSGKQGSVVYAYEICGALSEIGRKESNVHRETVDEEGILSRFQHELDDIFSQMNRENLAVRSTKSYHATSEEQFYALIMIAATDTYSGRIWRTNPYPSLRGALIAAECKLGDVYNTLRKKFNWSVRRTYGEAERALENNKYVYTRINLFESNLSVDDEVIYWRYERMTPIETTYDNGYICTEQKKGGQKGCRIDEVWSIQERVEEITAGWLQESLKLHTILTDPNLLTIDFEKDAYVESDSGLTMPNYFNKWIRSPMFNARLRLTKGRIYAEKTSDPWNNRIMDGTIKASTESLGYALGGFYDLCPQFVDDVLSTNQQQSSVFEYLSTREDFSKLTPYARGERVCPHTGGVLYTLRRTALEVLTNYMKLDPECHQGSEYVAYRHPSVEYDHLECVLEMEDLAQLVCYVIDCIFERRRQLRDVMEARRIVNLIQSASGKRRHEILERVFPTFFTRFLKLRDVELIRDLSIVNFLPLLFLVHDNIVYQHRQWSVPMILYDRSIKLIPVEVGAHANRFGFKSFYNFIQFHPGDARKRQEAEDAHKKMGQICYAYYTDTTISQGRVDVPVITTKLDTLKVYMAAICGGLSDSLVYALPVAHPEKCIVLITIGDDKLDPHIRAELVVSKYRYSRKHIRGVVSICLNKTGSFKVYANGIAAFRICDKTILNYSCKAILIKTPGYVFGNDELMTKLLNV
uniref:Outer capsid protein VP2 n=1 Tax=Bluetongue virus TaxID=40051 RepID=A0A7I8V2A2_BTV|nr:VP2 [Bluetongue virus]